MEGRASISLCRSVKRAGKGNADTAVRTRRLGVFVDNLNAASFHILRPRLPSATFVVGPRGLWG